MDNSWVVLPNMVISTGGVSAQLLAKLRSDFRSCAKNLVAMNAVCRSEITNVLVKRDLPLDAYHVYSDRLEVEGKATNQKSSGRCWLFAAANVLRLSLMKKYKLDDFEFSQTYLCWFDKLEKSNWFLENVLRTFEEPLDGRLIQFLLKDPVQDGGQWDMAVNLIEKYGLVPKAHFSECAHSGNTRHLNWMITAKLRENAAILRRMHKEGQEAAAMAAAKDAMMGEIYRILAITLGEPPASFTWSFRDKDKKFTSFPNLTPQSFYKDHVRGSGAGEIDEIDKMVSLIHDPRNAYYRLYTVEYLGNVVGGRPTIYINVPIDVLKEHAAASIKRGSAVWFGCDVGKFSNRKSGIMDVQMYDYESAYGVTFGLDKADRLRYGESMMAHAMTLTGVHLEGESDASTPSEGGRPQRWRVENSWGDDGGEKGYFSMTDAWFTEYVFQIVVDSSHLPMAITDLLKETPAILPPWVRIGAVPRTASLPMIAARLLAARPLTIAAGMLTSICGCSPFRIRLVPWLSERTLKGASSARPCCAERDQGAATHAPPLHSLAVKDLSIVGSASEHLPCCRLASRVRGNVGQMQGTA